MLTALLIAALSITGSQQSEPVYVLEYPGVAFGWLPEDFAEPVEGTLTEETGAIASSPNTTGTEYHLHYWFEELELNTRKDDWLSERFRNLISPDILPSLLISSVDWTEGSTLSPYWETSSVGLVPELNFNVINENGIIEGKGKACAVFAGDYSILFYMISPGGASTDVATGFDNIVGQIYLVAE